MLSPLSQVVGVGMRRIEYGQKVKHMLLDLIRLDLFATIEAYAPVGLISPLDS